MKIPEADIPYAVAHLLEKRWKRADSPACAVELVLGDVEAVRQGIELDGDHSVRSVLDEATGLFEAWVDAHRVNQLIRDLLADEVAVDVYVLPDSVLMHYGSFHINLAAAPERDIIRKPEPKWNVMFGPKQATGLVDVQKGANDSGNAPGEDAAAEIEPASAIASTFRFTLQPTYWHEGFFNGGVEASLLPGADGDIVEIFFAGVPRPIRGTINRTCNANGTPRVFCGPELRAQFQRVPELTVMRIDVLSPTSLRIGPTSQPR